MSQLSGAIRTIRGVIATLIGHARCSTDKQDIEAQRQALLGLGVVGSGSTSIGDSPGPTDADPDWTKHSPPCAPATRSWCPSSTGSHAPCPTHATSVTRWWLAE